MTIRTTNITKTKYFRFKEVLQFGDVSNESITSWITLYLKEYVKKHTRVSKLK